VRPTSKFREGSRFDVHFDGAGVVALAQAATHLAQAVSQA